MDTIENWRAVRLAALTAEDGWLNLTDRIALEPGRYRVGSDNENDVVISPGPAALGVLSLQASGDAALTIPDGRELKFEAYPDAFPRLKVAGLMLEIHAVGNERALRVRDLSAAGRTRFAGLRYFTDDPAWTIRADWHELSAPERTGIGMVGGRADTVTVSHVAKFRHEDREITLVPTHIKAGKPMFVIRDATSGKETYAASRFLIGEDLADGQITLDFNRAHNPPCAFTDLAICPLPPPGNVLPFAVRAGELAPL